MRYSIAIFGGIAFTALAYFIFLKGLGASPYMPAEARDYINDNVNLLLVYTFIASTILMEVLHLLGVNIFKFIVLMGTFALAMAFAGNDLVNFIGVPLAGLDSYNDYVANGNGVAPTDFLMTSLMESAKTPLLYLVLAGVVMIVAMATSKKAQNVIKTSVDLSRQDEGDEMFGSSRAARSIVRATQDVGQAVKSVIPGGFFKGVGKRFDKNQVILEDNKAAFDVVRAAVNLVLASMLITIGTNYKLPLSTTYVTFMVAMGSSLADKAWSRESAVFRVTGVLSVIGGWFMTAAVAFLSAAFVCILMYYGGIVVQTAFIALVIFLLIRSSRQYKKKEEAATKDDAFRVMMRTRDPEIVWDLLRKHVTRTQSYVNRFALEQYNRILDGFENENVRTLRKSNKDLKNERDTLKKLRRQEMLGLKKSPTDIAIERNTWFHLGQHVVPLGRQQQPAVRLLPAPYARPRLGARGKQLQPPAQAVHRGVQARA